MSQQRGTATDRLADIIQAVLVARQTGILQVERSNGNTHEEGSIVFANGQVIEARGGGRSSEEALNWLKTWRACRFVFTHKKLEELVPPTNKSAAGKKKQPPPPPKTPSPPLVRETPPPFTSSPNNRSNGHYPVMPQEPAIPPASPALPPASPAPYRLQQGGDALVLIERLGLSRMHRHIYLLIDGQRTAKELAWLTRLSPEDIRLLLNDLQRAGLIRQ